MITTITYKEINLSKIRYVKEKLKFVEKYNMSLEEITYWKKRYSEHKRTAVRRVDRNGNHIKFLLSFEEWMDIWIKSGQIHNRGLSKGQYVMSRLGDLGNYELGNVVIQTTSDNRKEGITLQPVPKDPLTGQFCKG